MNARASTVVGLLALAACGHAPSAPVGTSDDARAALAARKAASVDVPASGHMVAFVGERSVGPFLARRGSGASAAGMVAWVTVAEASERRVIVVPLDGKGQPRGGETPISSVSLDTTMLVVKPMRGRMPGFALAWTSLTDRGKSLWAIAIADDGSPRAKPVEITRTTDDIVWVDMIPTEHGAVCLWAEETRGGDANVVAATLDESGKVKGAPVRVAHGIVGWHAFELDGGIGLSTVSAPLDTKSKPDKKLLRDSRPGGSLVFQRLDAEAHPTGPAITITNKPIVSGDIEVVRDGGRLVYAWTDRTTEEPTVAVAALSDKNVVEPPKKLVEARGGASLLSLSSGPAGVSVLFEAPVRRRGEARRVHVTRLASALGMEGKPLSLDVIGRGQPELASTTTGFAVLATLTDCPDDTPDCASNKAVATVLRTDAQLGVVQREPLTFLTDPATLGWGMSCDGEICYSLAASPGPPGSPSRIRSAIVRPRPMAAKAAPPAVAEKPKTGAHATDLAVVGAGESVIDIATAHFGETMVVATLTSADSAGARPRGPNDDTRGGVTLSTRIVGEKGVSTPLVVSPKALPVGGVAIAGAERPEDGGAIAWVAREGGEPQVHVTRIDRRGKRTNDIQLTTKKGEAANVTLTWADGGWIVAWVDGRDGNGEVYATKVMPDLSRVAREERITKAPGEASDLVAIPRHDSVLLAWADSRESPRDGLADIYVTAVSKKDAKRTLDETRVLATAAHSRTPRLTTSPRGVELAWIEEAPLGSASPNAGGFGAFWVNLDDAGKPAAKPIKLPLAGDGAATAVALERSSGLVGLRAIVARSTPDAVALDAIDLSGPTPRPGALLSLDGPPSLDVALVLDRDLVYFNDEGPRPADRRLRRARVVWAK